MTGIHQWHLKQGPKHPLCVLNVHLEQEQSSGAGNSCPWGTVEEPQQRNHLSHVLSSQVRRMVGALVAVGQGKLTPHQIKELLELRDARALPPHAMAPPAGLFLKCVEYNEAGG